jgi:hypothetical protein
VRYTKREKELERLARFAAIGRIRLEEIREAGKMGD